LKRFIKNFKDLGMGIFINSFNFWQTLKSKHSFFFFLFLKKKLVF
jgi:hypothetical protein